MAVIAPTPYAVIADLTLYGAPAAAFTATSTTQQQAALDAANALVDGSFADKFVLPLLSWGKDLVKHVVAIATYDLIVVRGSNPTAPGNEDLHARWEAALKWLQGVSDGKIKPNVIDNSAGGIGGPTVLQASTQGTSQAAISGAQSQNVQGTVVTGPPSLRGWK